MNDNVLAARIVRKGRKGREGQRRNVIGGIPLALAAGFALRRLAAQMQLAGLGSPAIRQAWRSGATGNSR